MPYPFDCITDFIFLDTGAAPADIILIPGSYHPVLMERAADLYHQGLAPYILASGGCTQKDWAGQSESEFLRQKGIALGVPDHAILKEDQARHTFDNARLSWKIIQENHLDIKKAILVCKGSHSRRALLTYQSRFPKAIGFSVCTVPDENRVTRDNWFLTEHGIKTVMGEVVKIGRYFEEEVPALVKA